VTRVVVLRALGLGDFLTGVPALRAVRDAYPDADIALAAPATLSPVAALSETVNRVLDTPPLAPLDRALHDADVAVNLHGRGPQSTALLLASKPRRIIAFTHPDLAATAGLPRWRAGEHEVSRWCRLLAEYGIPADPSRLRLRRPARPSPAPGAVIVHPGAGSPARRWPPDRWAAVARALRADGHRVVVTGSGAERALAADVAGRAGIPAVDVLAGRTGLETLAALTADASLVLSGDTGLAHLAAAYGRPAVTLCGPVPPALWGPPPRPWHAVLWAGGSGDPHGAVPDPGLLRITVSEVITAARQSLAARLGAPLRCAA
jgi:ADP-heptose:LPS heptosyltransferase